MTRAELLQRLRELKPWLESQGVVDLRLFGSFARDEARDDSDLLCTLTRRMGWSSSASRSSWRRGSGARWSCSGTRSCAPSHGARRTGTRSLFEGEADLVEIMREAIRRVTLYTTRLTADCFLETQMTIDAVALNLLMIGECANRLPKIIKLRSTQPRIKMVALRHRIAHGYTSVDPDILCDVAQDSLPALARALAAR